MPYTATISAKQFDKVRIDFFNAAQRHELSLEMQEKCKSFARKQLTISMDTVRQMEDWFSRVGLRFRIKMRLYLRLARSRMGPVFNF